MSFQALVQFGVVLLKGTTEPFLAQMQLSGGQLQLALTGYVTTCGMKSQSVSLICNIAMVVIGGDDIKGTGDDIDDSSDSGDSDDKWNDDLQETKMMMKETVRMRMHKSNMDDFEIRHQGDSGGADGADGDCKYDGVDQCDIGP